MTIVQLGLSVGILALGSEPFPIALAVFWELITHTGFVFLLNFKTKGEAQLNIPCFVDTHG